MSQQATPTDSRLPHRLAAMLVCAVFPLLWVGGLVTTTDAGMAVPDWPTTYGYNLFLYPWQTWLLGPWDLFIEHSHRLMGAAAGLLAIGFCLSVFLKDNRRWLQVASVIAVLLVSLQGLLGGRRVQLDDRTLAMVHGCLGPAFFALAVALAVFTSRQWREHRDRVLDSNAGSLHRLALITLALAYAQLVLGAVIRHTPPTATSQTFQISVFFHLFMAAVLTLHIGLLVTCVVRRYRSQPWLLRPAIALAFLILVQLGLGVGAWVVNYGWPAWFDNTAWGASYVISAQSLVQTHIVTAHMATGSLILATCTMLVIRGLRLFRSENSRQHLISPLMMGVTA